MAQHELMDTRQRIFQQVAERWGLSRRKVESIWESQFDFLHKVMRDESIPYEKYPGVLLLGFGRFYCTNGKMDFLKKLKKRKEGESV